MDLGHSCTLKTILLSDLVGCDSPLQIVMAFWRTIIVSRGLSHPTQKVGIQTKRAPTAITTVSAEGCHTQMDGQHCPLITYQGVFSRVEKPFDDINSSLFLMNKKGLTVSCTAPFFYKANNALQFLVARCDILLIAKCIGVGVFFL
jgi:hypothetical protein